MYNIARWQSIKGGAVASWFLHLDWDLFSSLVFFGSRHQQYKKHGYLLWQCHVPLIKKGGKSSSVIFFFKKTALHPHGDQDKVHCMVTSKSIYFLKKIKYDHENRHTFNYKINHYEHNLQGCHSLNAEKQALPNKITDSSTKNISL